jgi:acetoin utilization deacetylase AcuC-like enzyme
MYKRVGILDIDYHSGNGSLAIFYRRSDVFFVSLHASVDIDYPYNAGFDDQTGEGEGEGYSLNINFPAGTKWPQYKQALQRAIAALKAKDVEALVVSLGADTVSGDPEAQSSSFLSIDIPEYHEMGAMIAEMSIPTIYVQEGGYDMKQIGQVIHNVLVPYNQHKQ